MSKLTKFTITITAEQAVESLVDKEIAEFLDNLEQGYGAEITAEVDTEEDEGGEE